MHRVGVALDEDHELVATQPCDGVGGANATGEPAGDEVEELIAGVMPEGVVDKLEIIEIQRHDADGNLVALAQPHRMLESLVEQGAVGQPGERISASLIRQLHQQLPVLVHG